MTLLKQNENTDIKITWFKIVLPMSGPIVDQ